MRKRQKAIAAVSLALVMGCGMFAGCDLITTDATKDMKQIIAEVDISASADFAADGEFAAYKSAVEKTEISKRDLVASFISNYSSLSSYLQSGSASYKDIFDTLSNSLVERQIYLQYAKVYLLKNGALEEESTERETFSLSEYEALTKAEYGSDADRDIALLGFFLTQEERDRTDYNLRAMFNNSIDSIEEDVIKELSGEDEDETEYESDVRTLPTGVGTENSDYYDNDYRIYTGAGDNATNFGSYERVKDSTVTSRRTAYNRFLGNLRRNDLLEKGEDTSKLEELNYFKMEKKSAYESALISKLTDTFTAEAVLNITEMWCDEQFQKAVSNQKDNFTNNPSGLKSALDAVSDSSFVLTSPAQYGFVLNILLPFSAKQEEELKDAEQDYQDGKGNKFVTREKLLENVTATDQRGSWFTGETDYSFEATDDIKAYKGADNDASRKYLFFEDELKGENTKYEPVKNYLGHYTYNGTYNTEKRVYEPKPIKIDDFIKEMNGYLNSEFGKTVATGAKQENYGKKYYNDDNTVNYNAFLYYKGKVEFDGGFNANHVFKQGSQENLAMSVVNELLFAYNTDPGGFNSYLGYVVVADKTDFVSEFEYAAQLAVQGGAGTYTVAPSDYGWHIMYCTFAYNGELGDSPYTFEYSERYTEGTFSNLYFESLKPEAVNTDASNRRTKIISSYKDCSTVYEERYSDWSNLG